MGFGGSVQNTTISSFVPKILRVKPCFFLFPLRGKNAMNLETLNNGFCVIWPIEIHGVQNIDIDVKLPSLFREVVGIFVFFKFGILPGGRKNLHWANHGGISAGSLPLKMFADRMILVLVNYVSALLSEFYDLLKSILMMAISSIGQLRYFSQVKPSSSEISIWHSLWKDLLSKRWALNFSREINAAAKDSGTCSPKDSWVRWFPPKEDFITLNIGGSRNPDGNAAAG
ncbi:hypothetical protein RJ641_031150, partial [Dillenia turbinata]